MEFLDKLINKPVTIAKCRTTSPTNLTSYKSMIPDSFGFVRPSAKVCYFTYMKTVNTYNIYGNKIDEMEIKIKADYKLLMDFRISGNIKDGGHV